MKRALGRWFVLVVAIILTLVACAPAAAPATSPTAAPAASPTAAPATSPAQTTPSGTYIPSATLNITAQNFAFDKSTLTIHSRTKVTLVFDNKDSVPHNAAIYTDSSATNVIFKGEVFTGPKVMNYEFTAPALPGTYFFCCDVHPNMKGIFVVTQ